MKKQNKIQKFKGQKRPSSPDSADNLFIVSVAVQHDDNAQNDPELFAISYQLRTGGKKHSGIFQCHRKSPKLSSLVGHILIEAKAALGLSRHPTNIVMVSHGTDLLLSILKDAEKWTQHLDEIKSSFVSRLLPLAVSYHDASRNTHTVSVWLMDTKRLGPERDSLPELAQWIGPTKLRIPNQGQWGALFRKDAVEFAAKAKQAAEISGEFALQVARYCGDLTGEFTIPLSLGALAEKFVIRELEKAGREVATLLGYEVVLSGKTFSSGKKRCLIDCLHTRATLATESYHGGRNESFFFGISDSADWRDLDLKSAYPTSLATLGIPLWTGGRESTNLDDFCKEDVIGVALVEFAFPAEIRFPLLPVRVDQKLIFPLQGKSYATAPELLVARNLGADIKVLQGFVVPMDMSAHPFEGPIRELTRRRSLAHSQQKTLDERLTKLLSNSIPGKMGQGLDKKRDDPEHRNEIAPCKLTQPFLAAHVTGMTRAVVGEILNALPKTVQILSVTTDGFLSNATQHEIGEATTGSLCKKMAGSRQRTSDTQEILEVKRNARQLFGGRNRVMATLETAGGHDPILSRSGIITPSGTETKIEQNQWLVEKFFEREPKTPFRQRSFAASNSARLKGKILIREEKTRPVRLDYDFDRAPDKQEEKTFNGKVHISFSTKPWETADDYRAAAQALEEFQRNRCLKTMIDLEDMGELIEARQSHHQNASVKSVCKVGGALEEAKRQFLRALKHDDCGLGDAFSGRTQKEVVAAINSAIAATTLNERVTVTAKDLTNARLKKVTKKSVPRTGRSNLFMKAMKELFPSFQPEELLAPERASKPTNSQHS